MCWRRRRQDNYRVAAHHSSAREHHHLPFRCIYRDPIFRSFCARTMVLCARAFARIEASKASRHQQLYTPCARVLVLFWVWRMAYTIKMQLKLDLCDIQAYIWCICGLFCRWSGSNWCNSMWNKGVMWSIGFLLCTMRIKVYSVESMGGSSRLWLYKYKKMYKAKNKGFFLLCFTIRHYAIIIYVQKENRFNKFIIHLFLKTVFL